MPPSVVEERVPSPVWTLALPQRIRESDNTFRLAGLPANLSSASRISFFLSPGFRIARTNGTFFSSGVSGALGGRGSGEMSLTVGYASRGFDDISLRLKHDELRCSARTEWLACLQAIQFDFAEESSLLVLCTTPWRVPRAQLRYVPEAHQLVLPLDAVGEPALAQAIVRAGPAEAWSARLRIGKGAPLALSVKPRLETRSFDLPFSPDAVQWLSALELLRDSSLRREWMLSQGADWALVRSLVEDGVSNGWNLQELLAPLCELAQRNLPGAPLDPVPAELAPAAAWVDVLENSLASVPVEELHAVVVELCGKAQALLSAVLEPLVMLETGSGLALDLGYGQTLLIKVEEP